MEFKDIESIDALVKIAEDISQGDNEFTQEEVQNAKNIVDTSEKFNQFYNEGNFAFAARSLVHELSTTLGWAINKAVNYIKKFINIPEIQTAIARELAIIIKQAIEDEPIISPEKGVRKLKPQEKADDTGYGVPRNVQQPTDNAKQISDGTSYQQTGLKSQKPKPNGGRANTNQTNYGA